MTCQEVRDRLAVFLIGELPADDAAARQHIEEQHIEEHIESCPACAERAGAVERLLGQIRDTSALAERDVPPDFGARLMSRVRELAPSMLHHKSRRFAAVRRMVGRYRRPSPVWVAGLAAAAVFFLGAYLVLSLSRSGRPDPRRVAMPDERRPEEARAPAVAAEDERQLSGPGKAHAVASFIASLNKEKALAAGDEPPDAVADSGPVLQLPVGGTERATDQAMIRPRLPARRDARRHGQQEAGRDLGKFFRGPGEYDYESRTIARLGILKGSVRASRGADGPWFAAFKGLDLTDGDRLDTRDGMASVEFSGGGTTHVNSSTVLRVRSRVLENGMAPVVALRRGEVVVDMSGLLHGGKSIHVETRDGLFSPAGTCYYVRAGVVVTVLVVAEGEVFARAKAVGGDLLGGPVRVAADWKCYVKAGRPPEKPTRVAAAEYLAWAQRLKRRAKSRFVAETFDPAAKSSGRRVFDLPAGGRPSDPSSSLSSDLTTGLSAAMDIFPDVFQVELLGGELVLSLPEPGRESHVPRDLSTGKWLGGMPFWTRESFALSEGLVLSCDMSGKVTGSVTPIAALCLYEITNRDNASRPRIVLRLDLHGGTASVVQGRTHEHDIRLGRYPARRAPQRLDRCGLLVDDREIVALVNGKRFGPFAWSITPPERVRAGAEGNFRTGYRGEPVRFDNFWVRSGVKAVAPRRQD